MPSLFGTNPFLILVFITINLVGTILILRQLTTITVKPYKNNRLAIAIKGLCILLSLCTLASTTNLLSDSVTYVHYAKRPVSFNYTVDKKDDTLYFKRHKPTQPRMPPISIGGGIGEQRGENKRILFTLN